MTAITDDHVEWAVVGRFRLMLEEQPHAEFNVTQSFALFTAVLCWVMQRIRIRSHEIEPKNTPRGKDDRNARRLYHELDSLRASGEPWSLPVLPVERIAMIGGSRILVPPSSNVEHHTVARLLVNLRDAAAHGDSRIVTPFNVKDGTQERLVGFRFSCSEVENRRRSWGGEITLLEAEMRAIGVRVATLYCDALRRNERHRLDGNFGRDAGAIREQAG